MKKALLYTVVLNGQLFYMSFCALAGIQFDSEEGAGVSFKIWMVLLFVLGVWPFMSGFLKHNNTQKHFFPLTILFIYVIVGFYQLNLNDLMFLQMGCFSVPAVCIALCMQSHDELNNLMKWFDLFLPIFAISFIFMVINIMLSKIEGTGTYSQATSYFSAYCFLFNLYLLRYNDRYQKFIFLDKNWYRIFKILLLPYFIIICAFSGGRGAFLTVLVGLLFNLDIFKKVNPRIFWGGVVTLMFLLIVVFVGIGQLNVDFYDLLVSNFDRISAVVSGGHIDTSASSGRDVIWIQSLKLFAESPIWGYPLYLYLRYPQPGMHPHNIFLEIMLQGGLILLIVFFIIILRNLNKYKRMLRFDKNQIFLMPFILYSSTMLMFSSSYTFEPYFWFFLTYIYNFKFPQREIVRS